MENCCLSLLTRNARLVAGVCALLALAMPLRAGAGQAPLPGGDPRLAAWSSLYLQGHGAEALAAVETDLRSAAPHPDAAAVWVALESSQGRLAGRWASLTDPALRRALGDLPDIALRYQKKDYAWLLADHPPGRPGLTFWAAVLLDDAASNLARYQDAYQYVNVMERERPGDFLCVWDLQAFAQNDASVWSQLAARVQAGGDLAQTPAGPALRVMLSVRPVSTQSQIAGAHVWLKSQPPDTFSLKFLGTQSSALGRYREAADLFEQSTQVDPFNTFSGECRNWEDEAKAFIRDGRPAEAASVVRRSAVADGVTPAGVDLLDARRMAQARSGRRGEGRGPPRPGGGGQAFPERRRALGPGGAGGPHQRRQPLCLRRAGGADRGPGRAAERGVQRHLISALDKSGRMDAAWTQWQAVRPRFALPSQDFYYQGADLLDRLKRPADELSLYEEAVKDYPTATWMLENSAGALDSAGRPADALKPLMATLSFDANNAWVIAKVRKCQDEVGAAKTAGVLADLRRQYPWSVALWADAAAHQDGVDAKVALWRQAAALNPAAYWPWDNAANALFDVDRLADARAMAAESRKALQAANSPDAYGPLTDSVWDVIRTVNAGSATSADEQQALSDLEQYRAEFGSMEIYQQYRSRILQALGRPKEAWQAALADARLAPDDRDALWELSNGSFDDKGESLRHGLMAAADHYLDRDPYDGARLDNVANLNVQWWGSSIIGYELEQLCKQRAPDSHSSFLEAEALGQLGDAAGDYSVRYAQERSGVSASDRYVQWFEQARLAAEKAGSHGTQVVIDHIPPDLAAVVPHTAAITLSDGTVELRRDNPISGKPERVQVGPAWVELGYDAETGENLESIRDSRGSRICSLTMPSTGSKRSAPRRASRSRSSTTATTSRPKSRSPASAPFT